MDLCGDPEDCQGCGWCLDEDQQKETLDEFERLPDLIKEAVEESTNG